MKGILKMTDPNRGYGFIKYGANQEIFFHSTHVVDPGGFERLSKGAWISFKMGQSRQGPMAIDVKRVITE